MQHVHGPTRAVEGLLHQLHVPLLSGTMHARTQVRMRPKHKSGPRALPGWGNVPNPEDWKVVDEAPEDQLASGGQGARSVAAGSTLLAGFHGLHALRWGCCARGGIGCARLARD